MAVFAPGVFPPNELWDYATRLYARGQTKDACLALQDRRGVDVNVLIFCCWVASSGRGIFREGELEAALEAVWDWRASVIDVLHGLKGHLKGNVAPAPRPLADDLRRVIVESELYAEHVEILMLHGAMARVGTGTFDRYQQIEDTLSNLLHYLALIQITPDDDDLAALTELLVNAFPEEQRSRVESLCTATVLRIRSGNGLFGS